MSDRRALTRLGRVLIFEEDPGIAELERRSLESAGYTVVVVASVEGAMEEVARGGVRLVVLVRYLPGGMTESRFHARLKDSGYDLPVVMLTERYDEATAIEALRAGVRDLVIRSAGYLDYLPEAVGRVLEQTRAERFPEEDELRALVAGVPAVLFALDRDGVFTFAEDKGLRAPGLEPRELLGRSSFEVYRDQPEVLKNVRRALAGE